MTISGSVAEPVISRKESWLYTPVDEVISRTSTTVPAERVGTTVSPSEVNERAGHYDGPRLVFVNGFFAAELSRIDNLPAGLWCGPAGGHHPPTQALVARAELTDPDDQLFADLQSNGHDIAVVIADDGAHFDQPVHIVHLAANTHDGDRTGVISYPHTIIDLGHHSNLAIVETYCGLDGFTVADTSTTVRIGEGAELDQCRIQIESPAALHIGHTQIEQGAGSRLRHSSITVGADIARNAIDVHLGAPDAHTELTGINITGRHQRHDTVVTVDHDASRCTSNQRFVGVVDDHGRGSFSGAIIVRPGTVATDAHQSNRNLVLDPHAEADTRPWLNILADDVRCTHGATVGRLDDDALFYLRSRGIALPEARAMLIEAFIRDIVGTIEHPSLREHVGALIDAISAAATTGTAVKEQP